MTHGTRTTYRYGCRCDDCKRAERAYRRTIRRAHAKGTPLLGRCVSASEAWARIRVLKQEGFRRQQMTGWTNRHLPIERFTPDRRVRLATLIRLRQVCRRYLIADSDLPNYSDGV